MSTEHQIAANRQNAQLSTGPRTEAGKQTSSLNAVKTGLTGRTVLLPGDDLAAYQNLVQSLLDQHRPEGEAECALVQSLADAQWRLLRIPSLEAGIYALGRLEFAALFEQESPAVRASLLEAKTFLTYQKQLNNLGLQETRLRRQWEKDGAALQQLQQERATAEQRKAAQEASASMAARDNALLRAVLKYKECVRSQRPFQPEEFGFEFSKEQIEDYGLTLGGPFTPFFQQIRRKNAA